MRLRPSSRPELMRTHPVFSYRDNKANERVISHSEALVRLKIAEAFPEGRGEAQGCAERARVAGTLHRARPESLKEKAEGTAKRRFSWQEPGSPGRWRLSRPGTFTGSHIKEKHCS